MVKMAKTIMPLLKIKMVELKPCAHTGFVTSDAMNNTASICADCILIPLIFLMMNGMV